jgi:hypothetical protein
MGRGPQKSWGFYSKILVVVAIGLFIAVLFALAGCAKEGPAGHGATTTGTTVWLRPVPATMPRVSGTSIPTGLSLSVTASGITDVEVAGLLISYFHMAHYSDRTDNVQVEGHQVFGEWIAFKGWREEASLKSDWHAVLHAEGSVWVLTCVLEGTSDEVDWGLRFLEELNVPETVFEFLDMTPPTGPAPYFILPD